MNIHMDGSWACQASAKSQNDNGHAMEMVVVNDKHNNSNNNKTMVIVMIIIIATIIMIIAIINNDRNDSIGEDKQTRENI